MSTVSVCCATILYGLRIYLQLTPIQNGKQYVTELRMPKSITVYYDLPCYLISEF